MPPSVRLRSSRCRSGDASRRPGACPAPQESPQGQVAEEGHAAARQGEGVGLEDVVDSELRPQAGQDLRPFAEAGAGRRDGRAVDGSRRRSGDDLEGARALAQRAQLSDALQNSRLIRAACAACRENQPQHAPSPRVHRSSHHATKTRPEAGSEASAAAGGACREACTASRLASSSAG